MVGIIGATIMSRGLELIRGTLVGSSGALFCFALLDLSLLLVLLFPVALLLQGTPRDSLILHSSLVILRSFGCLSVSLILAVILEAKYLR